MDIYSEITSRIVAELENGIIPWQKPWVSSGNCVSYATGRPYFLLNQMLLGRPGEYLTFKQVQAAGGFIRKGEKASMVVFWKWIAVKDDETQEEKEIPLLRYYNVFHIDQCDGIKARREVKPLPKTACPNEAAEAIICSYVQTSGVKLEHKAGDRAFYRPSEDRIVLPTMKQFGQTSEYYSTAFHEMVHSTGHMTRLNRLDCTAYYGSEAYSKEELVAEIGASALVNAAGLETAASFRNNAAYVQGWLKALRGDKKFIVSASGKADKAVAMILEGSVAGA